MGQLADVGEVCCGKARRQFHERDEMPGGEQIGVAKVRRSLDRAVAAPARCLSLEASRTATARPAAPWVMERAPSRSVHPFETVARGGGGARSCVRARPQCQRACGRGCFLSGICSAHTVAHRRFSQRQASSAHGRPALTDCADPWPVIVSLADHGSCATTVRVTAARHQLRRKRKGARTPQMGAQRRSQRHQPTPIWRRSTQKPLRPVVAIRVDPGVAGLCGSRDRAGRCRLASRLPEASGRRDGTGGSRHGR